MKIDGIEMPKIEAPGIDPKFEDEPGRNANTLDGRFQVRNVLSSLWHQKTWTVTVTWYIVVEINGKRYKLSVEETTEDLT